ncbi:MAG: hypothetical protein O7A09_14475, partial [Proteobacteria bacterium]|nr:hypothetical protein [Pseudomonadota bacterium]
MLARFPIVLVPLLCGLAVLPAPAASAAELRWRRVVTPTRGSGLTAIAADPRSDRVALGDATGVLLSDGYGYGDGGGEDPVFRRVARVDAVTDLVFDEHGSLWIGSLRGLWQLDPSGRLGRRSPAAGDAGQLVHRVATLGGLLVLATQDGAFVSARGGRAWQRLRGGLSSGPVRAVALRPGDGPGVTEAWLLAGVDLWRVTLRLEDGALRTESERQRPIAGRPTSAQPVDLAIDLDDAELVVLYPMHLARRRAGGSWRVVELPLPPGARARRIGRAGPQLWIAHDRGLQLASGLGGPWQRAGAPAGRAPGRGVVASGGRILAATSQGLRAADPVARVVSVPAPVTASTGPAPRDPGIQALHGAALRYAGLEPERFRALRRSLRWRGWLPKLSLHFDVDHERSYAEDYDEAFISGDTRFLNDWDRDRSLDYDGGFTLSWDLSDGAYDPEVIDLSREARQVIALRDDVLDEINQLYFERQLL